MSSPLPSNERILQNETSFERREYTDPITGAATISLIERSITQREVFFHCVAAFTKCDGKLMEKDATVLVKPYCKENLLVVVRFSTF